MTLAVLVGFLLGAAAIGAVLYMGVLGAAIPGLHEQRFGVLEDLPPDVNQWVPDDESDEGRAALLRGERLERRLFASEGTGFAGGEKLVRQVRYRNRVTNQIVRIEPDVPVKRRRIKR